MDALAHLEDDLWGAFDDFEHLAIWALQLSGSVLGGGVKRREVQLLIPAARLSSARAHTRVRELCAYLCHQPAASCALLAIIYLVESTSCINTYGSDKAGVLEQTGMSGECAKLTS